MTHPRQSCKITLNHTEKLVTIALNTYLLLVRIIFCENLCLPQILMFFIWLTYFVCHNFRDVAQQVDLCRPQTAVCDGGLVDLLVEFGSNLLNNFEVKHRFDPDFESSLYLGREGIWCAEKFFYRHLRSFKPHMGKKNMSKYTATPLVGFSTITFLLLGMEMLQVQLELQMSPVS